MARLVMMQLEHKSQVTTHHQTLLRIFTLTYKTTMKRWGSAAAAFDKSRWLLLRASNTPPLPLTTIRSPRAKKSMTTKATMATMPGLENVAVDLPNGLTPEQLQSFRPFKQWIETLDRSLALQSRTRHPFHQDPYRLRSITVQSFDRWENGRIGFVKVSASVCNSAGERLPAVALLRGPSVAMLVMLIPDDVAPDSDERYVVLTVQPRVPAGSLGFVELPAGMVDDAGSFRGAAAKEMEEELGIRIHQDELVCLNDLAARAAAAAAAAGQAKADDGDEGLPLAMYPSAGGCDEHITMYSYERRIPRSQLGEWSGRLTGLRSEGEKITLKLVPMEHLWKHGARDAKCLGALALWEGLKRDKKL